MIKFMATDPENGRKILGMVISDGNINKLKQGQPIHFHAEQLPIQKIECNEIIIMWYKTEEDAVEDLIEMGYITRDQVKIEKGAKH